MSIVQEERTQSKWTWDKLRGSDRRLLLRAAIKAGARITMLDNNDALSYDALPPVVQLGLFKIDWSETFRRA